MVSVVGVAVLTCANVHPPITIDATVPEKLCWMTPAPHVCPPVTGLMAIIVVSVVGLSHSSLWMRFVYTESINPPVCDAVP